jgi:thioredoxin 1
MSKEVTDASFQSDVLEHDKPIMVDFWAEWCGPCRAVSPILDKIAEENSDKLDIVKNGEIVKRVIGAKPKPALEADLAEFLA